MLIQSEAPSPRKLAEHLTSGVAVTSQPVTNLLSQLTKKAVAAALGISSVAEIERRFDGVNRIRRSLVANVPSRKSTEPSTEFAQPYTSEYARWRMYQGIAQEVVNCPRPADERLQSLGRYGGKCPKRWRGEEETTRNRAVFVIGGAGCGKSTIVELILETTGCVHLSADIVKRKLPEFMNKGAADHAESAAVIEKVIYPQYVLADRLGFLLEKLGTLPDSILRLQGHLHDLGYKTTLVLVHLDPSLALIRVLDRTAQSGRGIDVPKVWEAAARPIATYNELRTKGVFDEFEAYDNNVPFGSPPLIIAG